MKLLGALFVPFVPGFLVSCLLLIAILTPDSIRAQDCVGTNPFVLGSVVELPEACPDGSGPMPNTTCRWIEVSCAGMRPVRAQVRITEPTPGVAERGTVLLGSGGSGAFFYPDPELVGDLADLGFRVADRNWAEPEGWITREVGLRRQACRYATLLTWLHDNVHTVGALVASGNSAGSAEIGYALTSWGMGSILDLAVPTSGPALARLDYVCPNPIPPEWQALCLTIVPPGVLDCPGGWECSLSNPNACQQCSSAPTPEDLRADSVVHLAAVLDYPTTRVHFLFGQDDCSRAVPGGLNWANSVTSEKAIEFVPNAPHVMDSPEGRAAILRAIDEGTGGSTPRSCESDSTTMCLNRSRFRVTADWRKADGTSGQGQAVSLTPDSGYFWFFNPANIEAVVKVLNACSVNDHYWVFGAGLTNVEVTLRVVDTQTGELKTYVNPQGTAYQAVQDTSAFETCP